MNLSRIFWFLFSFFVRVTLVIIAICAVLYGLSLAALKDLEHSAKSVVAPDISGRVAVFADGDGAAHFRSHDRKAVALASHNAPLVSADLISGGDAILTTAHDGSVRLSKTTPQGVLQATTAPKLRRSIRERLWQSYGSPLARQALWLVAQVMPLHIPKAVRGRRGRIFRDCEQCPEMVEIESGSFLMGAPLLESGRYSRESPRHLVTIAKPFAVGKFEVTFAEWDACVADGGCGGYKPYDLGGDRGRRPVINVSWDDAQAYIKWLKAKTGKEYRLLSEAEWEYTARGGTTTAYSFGSIISKKQAQFSEGDSGSAKKTVEVGSFPTNSFGLHDMHGNVWEWCEDSWHANYEGAPIDGSAWTDSKSSLRVLRGGSRYFNPWFLRSAYRYRHLSDYRLSHIGFRLARTF